MTRDQLHVYAVGYEELTGERADLIEVLNLDEEGKTIRELVDDPLLTAVRDRIKTLATPTRNDLPGCSLGREVLQVRPRRVVPGCAGHGAQSPPPSQRPLASGADVGVPSGALGVVADDEPLAVACPHFLARRFAATSWYQRYRNSAAVASTDPDRSFSRLTWRFPRAAIPPLPGLRL